MSQPLAERLRPRTLDDYIGQKHLVGQGAVLRKMIDSGRISSFILWGPPGVGKTTLAQIIANRLEVPFYTLSAVTSGVKDVRDVIERASSNRFFSQQSPILFIDEIHRFSKSQQDSLLGAVEKGVVTLIGATTENPSFEVIRPLLSRCQLYVLKSLEKEDLLELLHKAVERDSILKERNVVFKETDAMLRYSGGDARKLLNILELVVEADSDTPVEITDEKVVERLQQNPLAYDKEGEMHYDIISAFIKSIRGSDPDGALYWLARMVEGGEDPETVNMQNVLKLREELFCSSDSMVIQKTKIWEYAKQDDLVRTRLNGTVICPEKTLACIVSTFDQHMSCFTLQPQVVGMLSCTTFNLQDIGFGRDCVFLIMPDEKSTYHRIITIFIKQIYELLIDNAYKKTINNRYPVRINFILDEFSSLPTISDFPQMITASRSRNIRFMLIIQSKHQLRQRYGDETDTIMSNCMNWMFLTSREIELLRDISELSGKTGTNNEPLISVSRLQHLNKDMGECLIFNGRKYPYFSFLPDIDQYDDNNYQVLEMPVREMSKKENSIKFFGEQNEPLIDDAEPIIDTEFLDMLYGNNTDNDV